MAIWMELSNVTFLRDAILQHNGGLRLRASAVR